MSISVFPVIITIAGSRLRGIAGSLAAALVLGACGGPSVPRRPVPEPSPSMTAETAPPPGAHVPRVALPDPAAEQPVSLGEALAYADRHAPGVQVARHRLGLGHAAMRAAEPLLPANPQVEVAVGPRFRPGERAADIEVSLQQTIDIAGERGLRMEAARRMQRRLHAELAQVRWQAHCAVHTAFHEALIARERARAAERLLGFQERLLEIAQRRLQAGDTSPLPVRLAEGETAQARVAHIEAQQAHEAARLRLAEAMGWPAAHPPEPAGTLDPPRPAPSPEELAALARHHQPALHALRAESAEAGARLDLAERATWPRPTVGIGVAREGMGADDSETVVMGSVGIPLPLWQRNQGARGEARAALAVAQAQAQAFEQQLDTRLARAAGAVDAAARRVAVYGQEILPTFEDNLRMLQRAYELGEIDILQVSVARERFLRIQRDALDAYADYFAAVAELEAVVGADVWPDERHERAAVSGAEP